MFCVHSMTLVSKREFFAYDRGSGEKEEVAVEGGSDGWDRKANDD